MQGCPLFTKALVFQDFRGSTWMQSRTFGVHGDIVSLLAWNDLQNVTE